MQQKRNKNMECFKAGQIIFYQCLARWIVNGAVQLYNNAITVKEPETEMQSESSSEITVDDDSGTGDTEQSDDDSESHQENTVDTETELTVPEVLEQAETNGIDLYAMDAGETVTFRKSGSGVGASCLWHQFKRQQKV